MQELPHHYKVAATSSPTGDVNLESDGVDSLSSAAPSEFGGPGDKWSPETLLVASVADCFILSFRAISRNSKLVWTSLQCHVEGTLEREQGVTKFTAFTVHAKLYAPADTSEERARRILQKAEDTCLITNSLTGSIHLESEVVLGA